MSLLGLLFAVLFGVGVFLLGYKIGGEDAREEKK
jgi:hypothetical protein